MRAGWGKIRNERQTDAKLSTVKLTAKRLAVAAATTGTAVLLMGAKYPKRW